MKKSLNFAFLSAIAFAGAVSFTACQSSDEIVDNPDYNPETNTVKAEFAISLPNNVVKPTRQTASIVQQSGNFRGIENIYLIAYSAVVDDGATTPFNPTSVYKLSDIESTSDFDKASQNAKVYTTLNIPVGVGAFMFYGKAIDDAAQTFPDGASDEKKAVLKKFHNGVLTGPTGENPYSGAASTFNFSLEPINTIALNTDANAKGKAILDYLKGIRGAISNVNHTTLHAYLTNFKPTSGSSASIQAAVQDLWTKVAAVTGDDDGKTAIKNAITGTGANVYASISDGGEVTLTLANLLGYPDNLNLPDGAAVIDWTDPANPVWATEAFGATNIATLDKYVYPPSLYYRANTPIGISNNEKVSENYGSYTWTSTDLRALYNWNQTVLSSTRSIALENQIQYAVGRLDLTIKAAAATLYDAKGIGVTVPENGFPVSAVLVGRQNNVGYNFEPNSTNDYAIYDKIMNNSSMAAKNGSASAVNHTLVLETAPSTKKVYVAVELTNKSGTPFKGKDGVVPTDGKFYLIGVLDLEATSGLTQTSPARTKVFEQDYITTANLNILAGSEGADNTTGLGAAYNVIPDLKDAELEVAFSVDLSWTPGLQFDLDI